MENTEERSDHLCCCSSCESSKPACITYCSGLTSTGAQFVDPLILMRVIRMEAHRRIAFLIAAKSMRRKFIGAFARAVGALPVGRALDSVKAAAGTIYLPDPTDNPNQLHGIGTQFDKQAQVGGLLVLPSVNGEAANAEILAIHNAEAITLKKEFQGDDALRQLTSRRNVNEERKSTVKQSVGLNNSTGEVIGTSFKTAPKVDQTKVYKAVFDRLNDGGCVGIFPEGGSHDRTELLPLKGISRPLIFTSV